MSDNNLDALYTQAKQALKAKAYDRAADLLRQILLIDENYKDVSRLLARIVHGKRRRWYNDIRLWGTVIGVVVFGLLVWIVPKLSLGATPAPTTVTVSATAMPTMTVAPTITPSPAPTAIPLTWKRISIGQDFQRDMVTAFATDKKDPDVIYAAMMNTGVYKTIDGGLSWRPAHQGLASTQVESLLIDSENTRILYAVAMDGIYKTEDAGENWFKIGEGTDLLMDLQNNSRLYARDENGIYETTDQGSTWKTVYELKKDCPDEIHSWSIHPADGNMLFLGGGEKCAGVYQSKDGGGTWALIGLQDKPDINHLAIGLDKEGGFSIYTSLFDLVIGPERGMYASHDVGANWFLTQHLWCEILNSDPNDPSTIYCAGYGLDVKRGKGPWQGLGVTSTHYTAIYIDHPNGTERIIAGTIYVSADYPQVGIFISTDSGASWVERDGGIGSARSELKIDPKDSARIYLAAYYYTGGAKNCTLYSSLDSGKNWSPLRAADWCGPAFDAANTLYMNERGALQLSSNGGQTWLWGDKPDNYLLKGPNDPNDPDLFEWGNHLLPSYFLRRSESISANPYFEGLVYDVGDPLYYSTGSGWQVSSSSEGLRDATLFYTDQSKMIYAIGRTHQSYSIDNGMTWQSCGEDVTTSQSDSRLALDLQGERLYLATPGQGVLISTDNCQSWQASNDGLSNLFVNTLAIDPNNNNTIYAGTDGGAYISYDGGQTWGQINDGLLGATVVYSIAVDKDSNVYAATPYGVFKLEGK